MFFRISFCKVSRLTFGTTFARTIRDSRRVHHFAVVPLGAVPARNAEPDIHSLYRAVETVTED